MGREIHQFQAFRAGHFVDATGFQSQRPAGFPAGDKQLGIHVMHRDFRRRFRQATGWLARIAHVQAQAGP